MCFTVHNLYSLVYFFIYFFSELNRKDPELDKVINIGFPMPKMDRTERRKRENVLKKLRSDTETKTELEKAARQRTCKLVFLILYNVSLFKRRLLFPQLYDS